MKRWSFIKVAFNTGPTIVLISSFIRYCRYTFLKNFKFGIIRDFDHYFE